MSENHENGYKIVEYAPIPEFDQATQYVIQGDFSDDEEKIYVGVEIKQLDLDEEVINNEAFDDTDV